MKMSCGILWEGVITHRILVFFKFFLLLGVHIFFFNPPIQASDVVLFKSHQEMTPEIQRTEIACRFYGLALQTISLNQDSLAQQSEVVFKNLPNCRILTAQSLPLLATEPYFSLINAHNADKPKILIIGVTPELDSRWLDKWSSGLIDSCQTSEISPNSAYRIADVKDIARELAGQNFATKMKASLRQNGFVLASNKAVAPLITVVDQTDATELAQFVRIQQTESDLFISVEQKHEPAQAFKGNWRYRREHFFKIAPMLMFLRFSLGEKCWHAKGDYANLTIDDPWLIEPYGFVSFPKLLQQMDIARFHSTIAFIPWNYDRNQADVVALLKQHPDRFSICVHGNNHDHREFWKYRGQSMIPGQVKSMPKQDHNIRQALGRMQAFRRLTGLDFDPVMVFPHGIAPEATLGMLKKYHFLATFNSGNVPLGAQPPDDPAARLRSVTIDYENLPSYHRFEASTQKIEENQLKIAVDLFLDNPVLLFCHHNLFQNGIDAFNGTAAFINRSQPQVQWLSLADIARKGYLFRKVSRNHYEVLAFSREFILTNSDDSTGNYLIRKVENFNPTIQAVRVNGVSQAFDSLAAQITFSLALEPGEVKKVVIESAPVGAMDSVWISKNTRYHQLLRRISDFRDLTLTSNGLGRGIDQFYTRTGLVRIGPVGTIAIIFFINLFLLVVAVQLRIRKSLNSVRRNSEKLTQSN